MIIRRLGILLVPLVCALAVTAAHAQEAAPPPSLPGGAEIPTAPVQIDHRLLFRVRGSSSYPAETRAAAIEARILELARDRAVSADAIVVAPSALGLDLRAGDKPLLTLVPADAAIEAVRLETLAEAHRQRIRSAILDYRASREPSKLLRGTLLAALAMVGFLLSAFAVARLSRRISSSLESRVAAQFEAERGSARHTNISELIANAVRSLRWIVLVGLAYVSAQFVLRQFPWTRWLSTDLLGLVLAPMGDIAKAVVDYVPSLLFLVTLAVLVRYGLRLLRIYFHSLERGTATPGGFEREWATPAYQLVRTLVIALTLAMAYPYLPGAGSQALQGISVLGGLMLSLGASAAVSNVIAGYFNIFGRVFRLGDMIQVGEVRGEVTQVKLLTTRLRTVKNEEVTLPNSSILSTNLINYSALARTRGLILHTEVGIGYEVPWRQVHAMLEEAARRTPDVLSDPAPFVLQRQLGDFAVVYQLNVYTRVSIGMAGIYSALHQHVLDVFNESGVQIMTPAYEGDPETPKIVPREAWYTPPAKPPGSEA